VFDYFAGTRRIRGVKASISCCALCGKVRRNVEEKRFCFFEAIGERLIQLYQSEPFLYDVNSDDYRNRELRVAATKRIAAALSVDSFGPKEVATKFKNLRNS
jgi:hypothetical protein